MNTLSHPLHSRKNQNSGYFLECISQGSEVLNESVRLRDGKNIETTM